MNTTIFYLDNLIFGNPKLSKKVNDFFRILTPFITILYFIFILFLIITKNDFTKIPYLIHAAILLGLVIFQAIVYTKYGRKFLKCTEESLVLKHKHSEKCKTIPWQKIRSIKFIGQSFVIELYESNQKEIKFKAPLEMYLDIRNYLKQCAGHLTKIEE